MNTRNEISLLADQELDVVVGGRIATGRDPKPAPGGALQNPIIKGYIIGGAAAVTFDVLALIFL
jgi:hypothetical protein